MGAGLLAIQFHVSTPLESSTAPVGTASSDQLTSFAAAADVAGDVPGDAAPTLSQVARPSNREKPIPVMAAPSRSTCWAGTSSRTHRPVAGRAPMKRRLTVPLLPYSIALSPQ